MKVGDKVFVVDWGKIYSDMTKWEDGKRINVFPFKTEIPQYSDTQFHWKQVYEPNLTVKGEVNKKEPTKLKERIPIYKNFKYEIVEIIKHPKAGQYFYEDEAQRERWGSERYSDDDILLLVSPEGCHVVIGEKGVSELTPQQYTDNQFNALLEFHRGKYSIGDPESKLKSFPKELLKKVYHVKDDVLFGSNIVKGKVSYDYIEGQFSTNGRAFIICTSVLYDGKGNADLPEGSIIVDYPELFKMFPDNKS